MNNGMAYKNAVEMLNRDSAGLFQKFNFFLITTGFFIAAFATIITIGSTSKLIYFDYFIGATGLLYSTLYSVIMSHNTRILFKIGEYIRELEQTDFSNDVSLNQTPYIKADQIVREAMDHRTSLAMIIDLVGNICRLLTNAKKQSTRTVGDHVYLVPSFFVIVWLASLVFLGRSI
jgi:hypothetical protein